MIATVKTIDFQYFIPPSYLGQQTLGQQTLVTEPLVTMLS
jgi:hypothetical protein